MPVDQIPNVPIEGQQPAQGRIAWWFELVIVRAFQRIFNALSNTMRSLLAMAITEFIEAFEAALIPTIRPFLTTIENTPGLNAELKNTIASIKQGAHQADALTTTLVFVAGLFGLLAGPSQAQAVRSLRTANAALQPSIPNVNEAWLAMKRGALSEGDFSQVVSEQGFTPSYKSVIDRLNTQIPDIPVLANMLYRKLRDPAQIKINLSHLGYSDADANAFIALMEQIPPLQDIIRMAVRDAVDDSVASLYGYDENYPAVVGEWASKIGIPADWAKRYWRAHWQLPSFEQGADMVHRKIIAPSDLETLLRINDYPPYWRKKMVEMTYSVITRVDARRVFSMGIISADELQLIYEKQGYNSEDAKTLTDWTVSEYGFEMKELSKAEILKSYKNGLMPVGQVTSLLTQLEYSSEAIHYLIANVDLQKQQELEDDIVENVRLLYIGNFIDEIEVEQKLSVLTPPGGYVTDKLKIWRLQKERAVKRPTEAKLTKFLKDGAIDLKTFVQEMKNLMYPDKYIEMYVLDMAIGYGVPPDELQAAIEEAINAAIE